MKKKYSTFNSTHLFVALGLITGMFWAYSSNDFQSIFFLLVLIGFYIVKIKPMYYKELEDFKKCRI